LALLYQNNTLIDINYDGKTVPDPENLGQSEQIISPREIHVEEQKNRWCLAQCCFSFIFDKNEAFRFKYEPDPLNELEKRQDRITLLLYINAFIFYSIAFLCPILFAHECGEGIDPWSHIIYTMYSFINLCTEFYLVFHIQSQLGNSTILRFNKWHVVEAIMGQVARLDLYTDVCFLVLLYKCHMWKFATIDFISLILTVCYPLFMVFRLCWIDRNLQHTLPKIERNCKLCFIRENMMLATVLDSFCLTNYESFFDK